MSLPAVLFLHSYTHIPLSLPFGNHHDWKSIKCFPAVHFVLLTYSIVTGGPISDNTTPPTVGGLGNVLGDTVKGTTGTLGDATKGVGNVAKDTTGGVGDTARDTTGAKQDAQNPLGLSE